MARSTSFIVACLAIGYLLSHELSAVVAELVERAAMRSLWGKTRGSSSLLDRTIFLFELKHV